MKDRWPTCADVLSAIPRAAAPWSGYIADQLDRDHEALVAAGRTGHPPRRSLILSRLRSLEASGLIECEGGPFGYYGYHWRITELGKARLAAPSGDDDGRS